MRFYTRLLFLFVLCILAGTSAQAQFSRDSFGKSRIQYKSFNWKLYSTQNFNVYFYQGGQEAAENAATYAERELKRITSLIGYYPYSKITLILYNSATDQKQSNIGLNEDQYQNGGETLFMKNKVELSFDGTQTEFKRDLSYKITELLLNDMMYGGSLKEALQSSYLLRLPDWFIAGVAAYTAEGWSMRMDNYIRNMIITEQVKPDELFKRSQELTGQSIWNYIAERYGYTSIQNILNLTRITRDVEVGITSSLNIPYKRFIQDWYNYYKQINTTSDNQLVSLPNDKKLFKRNKQDHIYTEPVLNPAGTLLAYVENNNGGFRIIVQDVRSGKDRIVWVGGYKVLDQRIDYNLPVLAWRSNTQLGFVEARRGEMTLRQVDARRRRSLIPFYDNLMTAAATLGQFSQVRDINYSEDGQTIVVSAVKNGQTDLYLLRANGRVQQQLTNDIYDDINPVFLKGGTGIAFSSNRWVDSADAAKAPSFTDVVNNYDIYLLKQQGPDSDIQQLTSSIASELRPRATDDGNLVYLSEESGIRSLYRYDLSTGATAPVSNFVENIENYDYVTANNTLALIARDIARGYVYLLPNFTPTTLDSLPKTSRQIILETRARTTQNAAAAAVQRRKLFEEETKKQEQQQPKREGEVNIENYQFNNSSAAARTTEAKTTIRRAGATNEPQVLGPLDYDLRFSIQNIITSVYSDPQLGFGIVAGVNMSDLFENHVIRGNAFLRTDLETSRFNAEYMNLESRFDYGMHYKRDVVVGAFETMPNVIVRLGRNEFSPTLVYPLSYSTSLRIQPKFVNTRLSYINDFSAQDDVNNFGGGNIELVYDNSVITGVNMMEGTRMKVGILSLKSFDDAEDSFDKFYVDIRRYQKLHREIVLAGRLSYGAFFGSSPKQFSIGGMDNWLFPSQDDASEQNAVAVSSAADFFFMQYINPLRGYNFNTRTGTKYLLANAELRIPLIKYLYNGPIASGFFRNLQFTAFADAGSAYNGTNPFTGRNSINTRVIGGRTGETSYDPFEITIINYRNPFLVGYGVGARTTLLGVYGKLDVAWSDEDGQRKGPKFYVTLGYDF